MYFQVISTVVNAAVKWVGNAGGDQEAYWLDAGVADLTWYYFVIWWNQAATSGTRLSVSMYNSSTGALIDSAVYNSANLNAWSSDADTLKISTDSGSETGDMWFDNIVITDDETRDLVAIRDNTSYL